MKFQFGAFVQTKIHFNETDQWRVAFRKVLIKNAWGCSSAKQKCMLEDSKHNFIHKKSSKNANSVFL